MPSAPMNPALAATGAGGLAAAVVVLLNAILGHFGMAITDPNVVAAEITVATSLAGVGAHFLTKQGLLPNGDTPAPPTPISGEKIP